jgi:hypothetical protein
MQLFLHLDYGLFAHITTTADARVSFPKQARYRTAPRPKTYANTLLGSHLLTCPRITTSRLISHPHSLAPGSTESRVAYATTTT